MACLIIQFKLQTEKKIAFIVLWDYQNTFSSLSVIDFTMTFIDFNILTLNKSFYGEVERTRIYALRVKCKKKLELLDNLRQHVNLPRLDLQYSYCTIRLIQCVMQIRITSL